MWRFRYPEEQCMPEAFETMIQKERERLTKQHEEALERRKKINDEIATIDLEFEAIRAYEGVKTGKAQKRKEPKEADRKHARRGSRQQGCWS
jgi:DNA-binding protein H-NS